MAFHRRLDDRVRELAVGEGADLIGVAPVEVYHDYYSEVEKRVKETGATGADFMIPEDARLFFKHLSTATNTLPTAKAIIVIGVYSYDESAVYRNTRKELRGKTARIYSYYPVARRIADRLAGLLQDLGYNAAQGQDVPLKHAGDRIGLGSYGKNGLLLTEQYGSYVALRDVVTDAQLEADEFKRISFCQDCDLCLKACPTGALYAPYKVNPRLCINPITRRENHIPPGIRSKMQNWICGCDICQEVCPLNQKLIPRKADPRSGFEPEHHSSHKYLKGLDKTPELLKLLRADYPDVVRRNAAIALANIGRARKETLAALEHHSGDAGHELEHYFRWAMERLSEIPDWR